MEIRKLERNEYDLVIPLILNTFMKFEAPEYPKEGISSFKATLKDEGYMGNLNMFAAFDGNMPMGIIAFRNKGSHVALFFVDENYQHMGVGRELFETAVMTVGTDRITVNSSPYAVKIYEHLGFKQTQEMQITDGIKYVPMLYLRNATQSSSNVN